jgi:murein DD-endopeptidase MepM/ murein hydrolase activator NlpD
MDLTTPGSGRRTRSSTLGAAVCLIALAAAAGIASASGGIGTSHPPVIKDAQCVEGCLDLRKVAVGGRAELTGKHLDNIEQVRLPGARAVDARVKGSDTVVFKVPDGAETGRPVAMDAFGGTFRSPVDLEIGPSDQLQSPDGFKVRSAEASPRKAYFGGKRHSTLDYLFEADGPTDLRIDVIAEGSGEVVDSIVAKNQEPYTNLNQRWSGHTASGRIAPDGDYRFQLSPLSGGGGTRAGFEYHGYKFPLRGRHEYGDGLGAGRNHQGQDIFAKCGTPIVAARAGRVQTVSYQSAAGYYVVIDGLKTGRDFVYMHMAKQGRPHEGEKVTTGERIGSESDTGDAQGCHLHFEMWSAPGWYEGGHVLNPTPSLKRWDRCS